MRSVGDSLSRLWAAGERVRRSTVARDSARSAAIKGIGAALNYGMYLLLAAVMTAEEFGLFGIGWNVANLMAVVAGCGLHTGILRWWPEFIAKRAPATASLALAWSSRRTIKAAVLTSAAVLAAGLSPALLGHPPASPLIFSTCLILTLAGAEFIGSVLRAQGLLIAAQLPRDVFWRGTVIGAAGAIMALDRMISHRQALLLAAFLLVPILIFQITTARSYAVKVKTADDNDIIKIWKIESYSYWGISVLYATALYVDVIIVGALLSPEEAAAYFSATRLVVGLSLLLVAVNTAVAPRISELFHSGKIVELQGLLKGVAFGTTIATLIGLLLLISVGRPLLALFNPAFVEAYPALILLGFAHAINNISGPMSYLLQLSGHGKMNFRIIAASSLVGIVVQLVSVPLMGSVGAALGFAVAVTAWNVVSRRYALTKLGVDSTVLSLLPRTR